MQHKSVPTRRLEAHQLAADVLFCLCWSDDFGRFPGGNWNFLQDMVTGLQDIVTMSCRMHLAILVHTVSSIADIAVYLQYERSVWSPTNPFLNELKQRFPKGFWHTFLNQALFKPRVLFVGFPTGWESHWSWGYPGLFDGLWHCSQSVSGHQNLPWVVSREC